MAATGLLYLAILTAFGTDLVARAVLDRLIDCRSVVGQTMRHATAGLERDDQLRAGRDPRQAVQRGAAQERVVQPARRAHDGAHPVQEGVRRDGEEVPDEHIVKGYEVSKGRYVVVDPDELEPFIPAATKTVDLEEFVDLAEIDPVYFDTPTTSRPTPTPSRTCCWRGRWRRAARSPSAAS